MMEPPDVTEIREDLRDQALQDQDHVTLHLFAENDALREIIVDLSEAKQQLEIVLDRLHAETTQGASM